MVRMSSTRCYSGGPANLQPGGPIRKHRSLLEAEPQLYSAACDSANRDIWLGAMQGVSRVSDHNTFDISELPVGRRAISSKWVFAWKQNHNGRVVRGKARQVAKGFLQKEGGFS